MIVYPRAPARMPECLLAYYLGCHRSRRSSCRAPCTWRAVVHWTALRAKRVNRWLSARMMEPRRPEMHALPWRCSPFRIESSTGRGHHCAVRGIQCPLRSRRSKRGATCVKCQYRSGVRQTLPKGTIYERVPHPFRHPSAWFDRLTNRAQGAHKFRDFPDPQFVEPVETNPEVTPAFAPHLFDHEDPLVCNSLAKRPSRRRVCTQRSHEN